MVGLGEAPWPDWLPHGLLVFSRCFPGGLFVVSWYRWVVFLSWMVLDRSGRRGAPGVVVVLVVKVVVVPYHCGDICTCLV